MNETKTLNLIVETDAGTFVRVVPDATALISGPDRGGAAEQATRSAVAIWGLPDFVFGPSVHEVGSGTRELGDALILLDNRAAIVQVKSRTAPTERQEREDAWIRKHAKAGLRQAAGTLRALRRDNHALTNLRGRSVPVEPDRYEWISVVVIDHENPSRLSTSDLVDEDQPQVVLSRRDWDFLFDQLRSTSAVIDYLLRIADHDVLLGDHPSHYYQLALADHEAEPDEIPEALLDGGAERRSLPTLPLEPVDLTEDGPQLLVRTVLEDIAETDFGDASELQRLEVLAEVDRFPVSDRATLGGLVLGWLAEVQAVEAPAITWRFRRFLYEPPAVCFVFGAASYHEAWVQDAFNQFIGLRHTQFGMRMGLLDQCLTVGVLLTPRNDGVRPWDTTMCRAQGDLGYTPAELALLDEFWAGEHQA